MRMSFLVSPVWTLHVPSRRDYTYSSSKAYASHPRLPIPPGIPIRHARGEDASVREKPSEMTRASIVEYIMLPSHPLEASSYPPQPENFLSETS
jgi:hypothetical protein